jgi:hypothetical protein
MTQLQREKVMQSQRDTPWSVAVFRIVGYGLLILSLFELIAIFVPLNLTNPLWQFETIGAIVGRIPVPLIGLVLVFFGEWNYRSDFEQIILNSLRTICLIFGVLLLLLIPLGIMNTLQIKEINKAQISAQYDQQLAQIEQIEKQLNQAKDQDLERLIKSQGRSLDGQSPQEAKQQFLSKISNDKPKMQKYFEQMKEQKKLNLLKNSVKWNLGALVGGVLFIYIWHLTRWAL